jgi:hypothetical protein
MLECEDGENSFTSLRTARMLCSLGLGSSIRGPSIKLGPAQGVKDLQPKLYTASREIRYSIYTDATQLLNPNLNQTSIPILSPAAAAVSYEVSFSFSLDDTPRRSRSRSHQHLAAPWTCPAARESERASATGDPCSRSWPAVGKQFVEQLLRQRLAGPEPRQRARELFGDLLHPCQALPRL